jgi:uncharacterized protein (DUF169 family)
MIPPALSGRGGFVPIAAVDEEKEAAGDTMSVAANGKRLEELLGLQWAPVAVTYRPSAPAGIPRVGTAGPSGCSYWKQAAEGQVFYTEATDHFNCPVGSYTHNIDLPPEKAQELQGLVETMVGLEYLRLEEVPQIPRRSEAFGVAIYAPLAAAPVEPDVVVVRGNARQMMLLTEAANLAGAGASAGLMGRPTCAMLPAALQGGQLAASVGCIGNRVYTALADDELYCAIPGTALSLLIDKLVTIVHANRTLEQFHQARASA